ncbi:phosphopantetheine-binding protein [Nonomuraea sp. NPDC005650]|uniref:phosphopantetheine-binding protein n=1 Tax=Nonomuraea sp. NPDC005650 TaxID=3157045 RepID=UPI0033AFD522
MNELDADDARPRGAAEELVAAIWCDVFDLERIGRHDDFYDLGGHSLLAIRMASRLRDTMGLKVPVRLILDHPTVAEMAQLIEKPA